MKTLSVVIVSWNTRDLLALCLKSLLDATADVSTEVFVVDNASSDGSLEMVRESFPGVAVIANNDNVGFARAANQAIPRCSGDFVLLLNPDTTVAPDALHRLMSRLWEAPQVGAVGPRIVHPEQRLSVLSCGFQPSVATVFTHYSGLSALSGRWPRLRGLNLLGGIHDDRIRCVEWISGACLMVRRSTVEQVGPLSSKWFMYGEDMEWCQRMVEAGWVLEHVPQATVVHHLGASAGQEAQFSDMWVRSMRSWYTERSRPSPVRLALFDAVLTTGLGSRSAIYLARSALDRQRRRMWRREAHRFRRYAAVPFQERRRRDEAGDPPRRRATILGRRRSAELRGDEDQR